MVHDKIISVSFFAKWPLALMLGRKVNLRSGLVFTVPFLNTSLTYSPSLFFFQAKQFSLLHSILRRKPHPVFQPSHDMLLVGFQTREVSKLNLQNVWGFPISAQPFPRAHSHWSWRQPQIQTNHNAVRNKSGCFLMSKYALGKYPAVMGKPQTHWRFCL